MNKLYKIQKMSHNAGCALQDILGNGWKEKKEEMFLHEENVGNFVRCGIHCMPVKWRQHQAARADMESAPTVPLR